MELIVIQVAILSFLLGYLMAEEANDTEWSLEEWQVFFDNYEDDYGNHQEELDYVAYGMDLAGYHPVYGAKLLRNNYLTEA